MVRSIALGGILFLLSPVVACAQEAEHLSLKQAIGIALEHNPECAGSRYAADIQRARVWEGIAPPPPVVSLNYDYIPSGSGPRAFGERSVVLSQSFDFPSTIVLRGSALSSEADAAEADANSTTLAMVFRVKRAYFEVLARQAKLLLASENLDITRDFAAKARIRSNAGEGTDLENLTARVQELQAQGAFQAARNDLSLAGGELHLVLGHPPDLQGKDFVLTDTLGYRPRSFDLDVLIRDAGNAHPILHAARSKREAASIRRSIAWSSILPSFTLSYAQQVQGTARNLYGISLGMSIPLWFLLDTRGQVQEAAAAFASAGSDVIAQENALALGVRNAYLAFMNEDLQVRLYTAELLPQSKEVFRVANASYQAGEISYLEYLQARQTLTSAHLGYVDALLQYNTAFARLEHAVGREREE